MLNVKLQSINAVADPGFSRGGGREPSRGGREHAKFSRKLHEIERIWTPRGGRASLTPPLDPPMKWLVRSSLMFVCL